MKNILNSFFGYVISILLLAVIWAQNSEAQPRLNLIHTYDNGSDEEFWDIYKLQDGGFVVCGITAREGLVMRTNPQNGDQQWLSLPLHDEGTSKLVSIIEADNGDFVAGGVHNGQIAAVRVSAEGEVRWTRDYGAGFCNAVIELKEGDFMLAGYQDVSGILIRIDGEAGEPVWSQTYNPGYRGRFRAMRETDGEVVVSGYGRRERMQFLDRAWALKAETGEGRVVWEQYYNDQDASLEGIVSTGNGDFALTGEILDPNLGRVNSFIMRIDGRGNEIWTEEISREPEHHSYGICRLPDGGFAYAGWRIHPTTPFVVRTDPNGQVRWESEYDFEDVEDLGEGKFLSLITGHNGELVACGTVRNERNGNGDGIIMRLEPDVLHNQYLIHSPEDTILTVLPGTTIDFIVAPRNIYWDELNYLWIHQQDTISIDTLGRCEFDELGVDTIQCRVSQEELEITIRWHITIADLYIAAFTPDTLNLAVHRGASVNFTLDSIVYTPGADPEILWTKTNLSNGQTDDAGSETHATIEFPWSGDYEVEGRVSRGESSDAVAWSVEVSGAIWAYVPLADSLEVVSDSVVHFEVIPSAPEDESLSIQWLVDGEMVLEGEAALDWAFREADSTADLNRRYLVQCVVADSVEADTVAWVVDVRELGVRDTAVSPPRLTALLEVSPNPFNSMLTIRYLQSPHAIAGGVGGVSLSIYDIAGREIFSAVNLPRLTASSGSTGVSAGQDSHPATEGGATTHKTFTWDASAIPAGVYFVRLQAGREAVTKKVVLMR